ncbi:MAG TPA: hypothetical protein VGL46_14960 [Pseudonocardiaceae bacterium]|jgi:hypothetical protein
MVFLAAHDTALFDERAALREALSGYVVFRTIGPLKSRLGAASWNLHVSVLSRFHAWAVEEGHAAAVPFTFRAARFMRDGELVQQRINLARRRQAKRNPTTKYLDDEFATMFLLALEGLSPDGTPDEAFREPRSNSLPGRSPPAAGTASPRWPGAPRSPAPRCTARTAGS